MSETYRGRSIPTIEFDSGWYIIMDGELGWFEAYSERAVLLKWKLIADNTERKSYFEAGLFEYVTTDTIMCTRCGAQILDVLLHQDHHRRTDSNEHSSSDSATSPLVPEHLQE